MLKITHIFLIIEHYRTANNSMTFLSPQWSLLVIEITFMWLPGHRSFFLVNNQVFVHKLYFSPDHGWAVGARLPVFPSPLPGEILSQCLDSLKRVTSPLLSWPLNYAEYIRPCLSLTSSTHCRYPNITLQRPPKDAVSRLCGV